MTLAACMLLSQSPAFTNECTYKVVGVLHMVYASHPTTTTTAAIQPVENIYTAATAMFVCAKHSSAHPLPNCCCHSTQRQVAHILTFDPGVVWPSQTDSLSCRWYGLLLYLSLGNPCKHLWTADPRGHSGTTHSRTNHPQALPGSFPITSPSTNHDANKATHPSNVGLTQRAHPR
jgi:hypothetical protein